MYREKIWILVFIIIPISCLHISSMELEFNEPEWRLGITVHNQQEIFSEDYDILIQGSVRKSFIDMFENYHIKKVSPGDREVLFKRYRIAEEQALLDDYHDKKSSFDKSLFVMDEDSENIDLNSNVEVETYAEKKLKLQEKLNNYQDFLSDIDFVPIKIIDLQKKRVLQDIQAAEMLMSEHSLDCILGIEIMRLRGDLFLHTYSYKGEKNEAFKTIQTEKISFSELSEISHIFKKSLISEILGNDIYAYYQKKEQETDIFNALTGVNYQFITFPPTDTYITVPFKTSIGDDSFKTIFDRGMQIVSIRDGYNNHLQSYVFPDGETENANVQTKNLDKNWYINLNETGKKQAQFYRKLAIAIESLSVTSIVYGLRFLEMAEDQQNTLEWGFRSMLGVNVVLFADMLLELADYIREN
ncbi:MAG: hypothetical protein K9L75_00370 [Spirochaetia bacterium]|nr:hypothetical protein [Spirochaetia bacterium]